MIEKCTIKDLEAVSLFYDKVTAYLTENINYPKWVPGIYPGRESTGQAIEEGVQYVCRDGGRITGAFILNDDPQGDYSVGDWQEELSEGEYLVIHTLASDPESLHRGIGRQMVDYCICEAKERGCKAIRLDVVPDNTPARRLYERMGFHFAGERDLKRNIEEIPVFALYERVISGK